MADVLGTRVGKCGIVGARDTIGSGIVASLSAVEAKAFSDTFGTFSGGQL